MEYVKKCFWRYCSFSGRANRKEFWSFIFFVFTIALGLIFVQILFAPNSMFENISGFASLSLWFIFCFLPLLSVSVRRLHDIDFSGWWILMALFPPLHIVLLLFFLLPGSNRINSYGKEPPKNYIFAVSH